MKILWKSRWMMINVLLSLKHVVAISSCKGCRILSHCLHFLHSSTNRYTQVPSRSGKDPGKGRNSGEAGQSCRPFIKIGAGFKQMENGVVMSKEKERNVRRLNPAEINTT